jgi:two-component sensor histidine kinase/PAS domain-containing protein
MPPRRTPQLSRLEQRIGQALLRERADEGVLVIEHDQVAVCTPTAADLLAWDVEDVLGAPVTELLDQLDAEVLRLHLASALRQDAAVEFVVPRPGRDNAWIRLRSLPLSSGALFLITDVTESELGEISLRRKEQRLLAANRSLRLAHVAAHAAGWEWRSGRSLRWLDLAAARDLEWLPPAWTEEEEITDWRSIAPPGRERAFQWAVMALAARGEASFEIEVTGADGLRHWTRIDCAVTERNAGGAPLRVSGVTVDVTAERLAAEALHREIAYRKRSEARQQLLLHELNHRVKNMLATVQSIARQSLARTNATGVAEFEERLMALAWAYEIITREQWAGASLREVVERTLAPHADHGSRRISLEGPDLWLTPNRALSMALAVHELATNAVKYGALSNEVGRVSVSWRVREEGGVRRLELDWIESGGPPVVPPERRGFGSRLVERSLAHELNGEATLDFDPAGLRCQVRAPVPDGAEG